MTRYLGGPETTEQVDARHEKYLRLNRTGEARMFSIVHDGVAVGGIGWWSTTWQDRPLHETGWFVLPEAQGHGCAAAGLRLVIDDVRARATTSLLGAFPSADNGASNAVCERAGFRLQGTVSFPFRETILEVNAWFLGLQDSARQPFR